MLLPTDGYNVVFEVEFPRLIKQIAIAGGERSNNPITRHDLHHTQNRQSGRLSTCGRERHDRPILSNFYNRTVAGHKKHRELEARFNHRGQFGPKSPEVRHIGKSDRMLGPLVAHTLQQFTYPSPFENGSKRSGSETRYPARTGPVVPGNGACA